MAYSIVHLDLFFAASFFILEKFTAKEFEHYM